MSEAVHYSLPSRFLTILRVDVTHGTTTTTYNNNNSNNYNHDNNSIKGLIDAKAHNSWFHPHCSYAIYNFKISYVYMYLS